MENDEISWEVSYWEIKRIRNTKEKIVSSWKKEKGIGEENSSNSMEIGKVSIEIKIN